MRGDRSDEEVVTVRVPDDPPVLTPRLARALLGILVELTTVPVLDGPTEGVSDEC
jgi:hypothetical protein